ncbi:MAG: hypothetical protein NTV51_16820 [Verrucomicrobia bacterium]|nr:hypothetical protein [Verrucomicrobiota bacterium]
MNSSSLASPGTTRRVTRKLGRTAALLIATAIACPYVTLHAASLAPAAAVSEPSENSAAILAELRAAIAQGDGARVENLVTEFSPQLRAELADPIRATRLAADLRASATGTPASAAAFAQIAGRLSVFTAMMGDGGTKVSSSAGILAAALASLLARPEVTAAAPAAVGLAANRLSALAARIDFLTAHPVVAAQIARDTVAVAQHPAVLQAAPAMSAAIAVNVSIIASNAAVVAAAPELARAVAAATTALIHHEAVTFAEPAIEIVEKNLGLTPISTIDLGQAISVSGG